MNFKDNRLTRRLHLNPEVLEKVFSLIAEIDAVKNSWRISGRLLPHTIERLTHSLYNPLSIIRVI